METSLKLLQSIVMKKFAKLSKARVKTLPNKSHYKDDCLQIVLKKAPDVSQQQCNFTQDNVTLLECNQSLVLSVLEDLQDQNIPHPPFSLSLQPRNGILRPAGTN